MAATKAATKRLSKEYTLMQREPPPFIWAVPEEKNILTWHFLLRGPPDSPFAGGEYHGVLLFPAEYPFKPPGIKMFTPSGRFAQDKKICFSMSDFHPGTWNPAWSVATILTGLLSFMLSDEMTTGSVTSTAAHKRTFAQRSHAWNISTAPGGHGKKFGEIFPDYAGSTMKDLPNMGEQAAPSVTAATLSPPTTTPPPVETAEAAKPQVSDVVAEGAGTPGAAKVEGVLSGLWEKWRWRWGIVLMFAVLVSRISSSGK